MPYLRAQRGSPSPHASLMDGHASLAMTGEGLTSAHQRFIHERQTTPAAFALAGKNGTDRKRTPVASKTAFEIADGTTVGAISPAPQSGISGRLMRLTWMRGTSGKRKIG